MFVRILAPALLVVAPLLAKAETATEARWKAFQANPKATMMKAPEKTQVDRVLPFKQKDIATGRFLEIKERSRKEQNRRTRRAKCIAEGNPNCKAPTMELKSEALHRVEDFLDRRELRRTKGRIVNRLSDMERLNLRQAKVADQPWSDTYWPMNEGVLGSRYGSLGFMKGMRNWRGYADHIRSTGNTLKDIYDRGDRAEISTLSPSEKYDLLIGTLTDGSQISQNGYLTPRMWEEGRTYVDGKGDVESWMGICQGWSAAAIMMPRPATTLMVMGADGKTPLTFYPSDLKGLASFLWAYGIYENNFIGGRCNAKDVRRDDETGRILDEECFDLNPANFHVALINQIGVAGRSMVLDATFDYEVWNQPIYSYRYSYVNPQTGKETENLKEATVSREDFTEDRFKRFRSNRARSYVGVVLELTYAVETLPTQNGFDAPKFDSMQTVSYIYDLELDKDGNIIGGEWYLDAHPDFLWKPKADARARSEGDRQLSNGGDWKMNEALPAFWQDIARRSAISTGMPLAEIVERMVGVSYRAAPRQ